MKDKNKKLPGSAALPPGMTVDEAKTIVREVGKEKALLKLTDEEILKLNLNRLDDYELVVAADRFEAMGRGDLWLEALERVCRSAEHNIMVCYDDVYLDVIDELRYRRQYEQAIYYQELAIAEDLKYCGGINLANNRRDLAEIHLEKGDFEHGLRLFEILIEQDPWDIWHYNNLAQISRMVGLYDVGALAAKRAIEIATATNDPEQILPQLNEILGDAENSRGKVEVDLPAATISHWHQLLTKPLPPMLTMRQQDAEHAATVTAQRPGIKIGRNEPCPCGSGKKYKKCCGKGD
jgi:tetratricopeptide (TPR) repeat protein